MVIQSGIKEVVYYSDKYHKNQEMKASRRMFDLAGVKYRWGNFVKILISSVKF